MELTADQALNIAVRILTKHGMSEEYARMVGDHLVDAAMCGYEFASLPRLFAIVEHLKEKPAPAPIRIVREDARSALIDGGDHIGYVVSVIAIDKAIEIARKSGIAVVGANNTWFSGRLAYYVERAARQGLVALHSTNTTARVAPYGGIDRILGTNPLAFAFPCRGEPLIVDIGTAATTWGEVLLRQKTGELLPEGWAVNADGNPTRDPTAALEGAFLPWGGHRGFGLSLVAQIFGILAGSKVVIDGSSNYGFFFLVFDPELLMPLETFKDRVAELKERIKTSRPQKDVSAVRVPGEASQRRRVESRSRGTIHVDDRIYKRLLDLQDGPVSGDTRG